MGQETHIGSRSALGFIDTTIEGCAALHRFGDSDLNSLARELRSLSPEPTESGSLSPNAPLPPNRRD